MVDHLEIAKIDVILSFSEEDAALEAEFKISVTPVRTLADVIAFNNKFHLVSAIRRDFYHLFALLDSARMIGLDKFNYLGNCRKRSRSMEKISFCEPKPQMG